MADQTGGASTGSTADASSPPPPLPQRRPRVREVSSRFMSPLIQSSTTPTPSDLRRSNSSRRAQSSKTDENLIPESNRSVSTAQGKPHQKRVKPHNSENCLSDVRVFPSRPDTPKYKQIPNSIRRSNSVNSSSSSGNRCSTVTMAARLLQQATAADDSQLVTRVSPSGSDQADSCTTNPSNQQSSSSCPNSPLCIPDVNKWFAERNYENSGKFTNDCARSLIFSSSTIFRPPHPLSSSIRSGLDVRKEKKVSINHEEDVHSLKILSNRYLQWRFSNAKAEACLRAQKREAERKLCSLGGKISDIRDNMVKKRNEFALLGGIKTLTTIVEAQMPYLDEWSALEEDYSNSLSGTTDALLSSSLRLPVSKDVRVDVVQLGDALNSALNVVELIGSHIQKFIEKAGKMDTLSSELARIASEEKARTDECGYMLSKTYSSQVNECSLQGTLMQLHYCNQHQPQKSETTA